MVGWKASDTRELGVDAIMLDVHRLEGGGLGRSDRSALGILL